MDSSRRSQKPSWKGEWYPNLQASAPLNIPGKLAAVCPAMTTKGVQTVCRIVEDRKGFGSHTCKVAGPPSPLLEHATLWSYLPWEILKKKKKKKIIIAGLWRASR